MNKNFDNFVLKIKSDGFNKRISQALENSMPPENLPFTAESVSRLYSKAVSAGIITAVEVLREYHKWLNE